MADESYIPTEKPFKSKTPEIKQMLEKIAPGTLDKAEQGLCTVCERPIGKFKDRLSKREYGISGLCQSCQDNIWG